MTNFKTYDNNVDYTMLKAFGIEIKQVQPWQFKLTHPDLDGSFVWYPERGSLIFEKPTWGVHKVGEYTDTEEVCEIIKKKIYAGYETPTS